MSTSTPDITKKFYSITVSGGTGTQAFPKEMAHELLQVIIIPPDESAEYKFYIQEGSDNLRILKRDEEITGTYNELLVQVVPLWGNHTFVLYGATIEGTYKLRIVYR